MYAIWVKIDETLPWIELKRTYETKKEAKEAAESFRNSMQMKIVNVQKKDMLMKAVATVRV